MKPDVVYAIDDDGGLHFEFRCDGTLYGGVPDDARRVDAGEWEAALNTLLETLPGNMAAMVRGSWRVPLDFECETC